MSIHSNIQTENKQNPLSNLNQAKQMQPPHSEHPQQHLANRHQYEWVATYIDGQYFLTDPQSMAKLKNIEAEIQQEKARLAKLEFDNISQNGSFMTYQENRSVHLSNSSFCESEFNESKHLNRKQKYKGELENEEDKYKQNLRNMQKKKLQIKQNMQLIEKAGQQLNKPKEEGSVSLHSQRKSKAKGHEEGQVDPTQSDQLVPSPRKSLREKEASYHKSRISKSIKQNSQIQQIASKPPTQNKQISIKESRKNDDQNKSEIKSKVQSKRQNFSKKDQKDPDMEIQVAKQSESHSVQIFENESPKTQKTQSRHKSVKHSSKSKQISVKQEQVNQIQLTQMLKSQHEPSIRSPSKKSQHVQQSQHTHKSRTHDQMNIVIEITPAVQQIPKNDAKSHKSSIINEYGLEKEKIDTKSHKSSIINGYELEKEKIDNKSRKSQILNNSPIEISQKLDVKSRKSNLLFDQKGETKSKKSSRIIHDIEGEAKSIKNPLIVLSEDCLKKQIPNNDIIEDAKSKKSYVSVNQGEKKHKQPLKSGDTESKKSSIKENESVKSKRQVGDDTKTKKSGRSKKESRQQISEPPVIIQQFAIKQSQKLEPQDIPVLKLTEDSKSMHSNKVQETEEIKSKKSSASPFRKQKNTHKEPSIKHSDHDVNTVQIHDQTLNDQKLVGKQQKASIKQVQHPPAAKQQVVKMDKSIQWSRLSEGQVPNSHINSIKFQPASSQNNSFINLNEQSMNQSSHLKLQQLNQELKASVNLEEPVQEVNMKKRKEYAMQDNQSEKKSKSFVIHSRNGSVKERSEKNYDKVSRSKASSKSKKQEQSFSKYQNVDNDSVTKEQLLKLHEQISLLQEKLKKVEERQQQIEKLEGTISKMQLPNDSVVDHSENKEKQILQTPALIDIAEVSIGLRIQPRLQLQSSIIQVNTTEDLRKKQQKDGEVQQKTKLKQEISRLKRIIRDMQIDKIKSIEQDNELADSFVLKQQNSRESQRPTKNIDRESSNGEDRSTRKQGWTNSYIKSRQPQQIGKIIHNNSPQKLIESPRKRNSQRIKYLGNENDVMDPLQSQEGSIKNQKIYNDIRRNDIIDRFSQKDNEFHQFVESSRVIAEDANKQELPDLNATNGFTNFSKIGLAPTTSKINYSRMVQQMKKNNPEQEQILPQIHIRDIKAPTLPNPPSSEMSQEELLQLAKSTYKAFGKDVDKEQYQLCVKKYKNCVVFTINNAPSECVLWHFSGKFYMGGWKSGEGAEGEKHGEGVQLIPDKHLYRGQFLNGKKHGTGIIRMANGNLYDGQWVDGIKSGHGVYFDAATKVVYSGEWKECKKDGHGLLKLSEKEYYYGTFVKSIKDGFGSEVFINGDKYKGEYRNGKFHGKGKYTWVNGSCYEGQFNEGVRHGQGSWKSAKIDGDIYIGTYENDKKNGYGRYVWLNGCMYEGGFANDVKHGKGRLTYQDGKEIKGIWEEGNLLNTESDKNVDHEDQPLRRSIKPASFHLPSAKRF